MTTVFDDRPADVGVDVEDRAATGEAEVVGGVVPGGDAVHGRLSELRQQPRGAAGVGGHDHGIGVDAAVVGDDMAGVHLVHAPPEAEDAVGKVVGELAGDLLHPASRHRWRPVHEGAQHDVEEAPRGGQVGLEEDAGEKGPEQVLDGVRCHAGAGQGGARGGVDLMGERGCLGCSRSVEGTGRVRRAAATTRVVPAARWAPTAGRRGGRRAGGSVRGDAARRLG